MSQSPFTTHAPGTAPTTWRSATPTGAAAPQRSWSRDHTQEALLSEVKRVGYTQDARLTRMWTLHVMPDARLRKLHPLVPSFLAQLELLGVDILDRNRYYGGEIHRTLESLRTRSCMPRPATARLLAAPRHVGILGRRR
jgi:hypothetical protein